MLNFYIRMNAREYLNSKLILLLMQLSWGDQWTNTFNHLGLYTSVKPLILKIKECYGICVSLALVLLLTR